MARNTLKLLAEKYQRINEAPLETEVNPDNTHRTSTHNVDMARTKANQAAEVAPQLHEMLRRMKPDAPLHAWMVTHVTQAADMLQDVLAAIKEDEQESHYEPVKETDFDAPSGDGEDTGRTMNADGGVEGAV